jgi:hypothetical protein
MEANTVLKKENIPFTQVPNVIIYDEKLSAQAKGVACYLFSRPDGWRFSYIEIASHFTNSEDTIRKLLVKLEEAGYLTREKIREGGKFVRVEYRLNFTVLAKTKTGKTKTDKTELGFLGTNNTEYSNTESNNNTSMSSCKMTPAKKASIEADKIAELFNSTCVSLAKIKLLSKSRMSQVEARLKELKQTPETYVSFLQDLFARIERSDFLTNRGGLNRNNWRASFDWIFAPRNFLKVIEGNYDNKGTNTISKLTEPDGWQVYFIKTYTTEALPASWADVPESKKITILKQINK